MTDARTRVTQFIQSLRWLRASDSNSSSPKEKQYICRDCRRIDVKTLLRKGGAREGNSRVTQRLPIAKCALCTLSNDVYFEVFRDSHGRRGAFLDGNSPGRTYRYFDFDLSLQLFNCSNPVDLMIGDEKWDHGFTLHSGQDCLGFFIAIKWFGARKTEFRLRPLASKKLMNDNEEDTLADGPKSSNDHDTGIDGLAEVPDLEPLGQPSTVIEGLPLSIERVHRWLRKCEQTDGDRCNSRFVDDRYAGSINLILIDVFEERLVQRDSARQYLALSYVWGQTSTLQTKKDNFSYLQTPGAISDRNLDIALTIRDAIKFTRDLDIMYLWVDCLCIIQDDKEAKHQQITRMDVVYSQAYMTIIAASGKDANAGLPGVRPGSRNFSSRTFITLSGVPFGFLRGRRTFMDSFERSHIRTRAWTFQERLLSRRCLYFFPTQVFFCCGSAFEAEGFDAPEVDAAHQGFHAHAANPLQYLQRSEAFDKKQNLSYSYRTVVNEYTASNLTYSADVLDAFSGIAALLRLASIKAGVVDNLSFGIPQHDIHDYLLWIPGKKATRRRPPTIPTWSWAGWVGEVNYRDVLTTLSSTSKIWSHMSGWIVNDDMIESKAIWEQNSTNRTEPYAAAYASYMATDWEAIRGMLHFFARSLPSSYLGSFPDFDDPSCVWGTYWTKSYPQIGLYGSTQPKVPWAKQVSFNKKLNAHDWYHDKYDIVLMLEFASTPPECHFMIIEWKGHYAERVGIGRILKSLWPTKDERIKHIVLN